jgi:hypothetical protein
MQKLRAEELWVAACVRAAEPGVIVGQHDDNTSRNDLDLDLSLPGGRTFAALEVTTAADPDVIKFWKVLDGQGGRWDEPSIAGGWSVGVRPTASLKTLRTELPLLLGALERTGPRSRRNALEGDGALEEIADRLGVIYARQGGTDFPGSIYLTPELPAERTGGCVPTTGDALSDWGGNWVADPLRDGDRRKLMRPVGCERHLFVIVPGLAATVPFEVNDLLMRPGAPLPVAAPRLPDEVTHVWVMSTFAGGRGFRWSPVSGWQSFSNDAEPDASVVVGCTC